MTVANWLNIDPKIKEIVDRIQATGKPVEIMAQMAYKEIIVAYDIPEFTVDISEEYEEKCFENNVDARGVYEEVGLVNFLEPNGDPRGNVMLAMLNMLKKEQIDIYHAAKKHFKSKRKIPKTYVIGYKGEGAESMLHFIDLKEGESWTDLGYKSMEKIMDL